MIVTCFGKGGGGQFDLPAVFVVEFAVEVPFNGGCEGGCDDEVLLGVGGRIVFVGVIWLGGRMVAVQHGRRAM